jgi:hypothetical protein
MSNFAPPSASAIIDCLVTDTKAMKPIETYKPVSQNEPFLFIS